MALAAPAVPPHFEWTNNAARELIRLRHHYHDDFELVSNNRHERIWRTISNQLFINRGFAASHSQCRRKWYSLKYGYENLKRLEAGENPHDQPITNPTLHDQILHAELGDEFWLRTGNYLLNNSNKKYIFYFLKLQFFNLFIIFRCKLSSV